MHAKSDPLLTAPYSCHSDTAAFTFCPTQLGNAHHQHEPGQYQPPCKQTALTENLEDSVMQPRPPPRERGLGWGFPFEQGKQGQHPTEPKVKMPRNEASRKKSLF